LGSPDEKRFSARPRRNAEDDDDDKKSFSSAAAPRIGMKESPGNGFVIPAKAGIHQVWRSPSR
jgi:hypothetical protein